MNLIRWRNKRGEHEIAPARPQQSLQAFRSQIDRLFDRFFDDDFGDIWGGALRSMTGWAPAFDVFETDDEVTVRAEIPGVDPRDIDVSIAGDRLTISGEKKEETEEKSGGVYRSERRFGRFERSVAIPAGVDADKIVAEHANGVLTIRLPRSKKAKPKRIAITAAKS